MRFNELPDEILSQLFCGLNGQTVLQCRLVCRRWKDVIDSFTDSYWAKICENDNFHADYTSAHAKYALSWFHTFKALNSWSKLDFSKKTTKELCRDVKSFNVLSNGILACLYNKRHQENLLYYNCSDTIVYYDTEKFKKIGEEKFSFPFVAKTYEENQYFIVMTQFGGNLYVAFKEDTQKLVNIGQIKEYVNFKHSKYCQYNNVGFTLIEKEVYFQDSEGKIYVSKLIEDNSKSNVETQLIANNEPSKKIIVAFSIQNGVVHALCDDISFGNIYVIEKGEFILISHLKKDEPDMFIELKKYGFKWQSYQIFRWLRAKNGTKLWEYGYGSDPREPPFYCHGKVYVTTRTIWGVTVSLCVHYSPNIINGPNDVIQLVKSKPSWRMSVKELLSEPGVFVSNLDIIETSNSHKILMLLSDKLFILEFPLILRSQAKAKIYQKKKATYSAKQKKGVQKSKQPVRKRKKNASVMKKWTLKNNLSESERKMHL